jgi:hypothetical protein
MSDGLEIDGNRRAAETSVPLMLGTLLDYAGVNRKRFAEAWKPGATTVTANEVAETAAKEGPPQSSNDRQPGIKTNDSSGSGEMSQIA